jgi:S-adenosyl methyltransferase
VAEGDAGDRPASGPANPESGLADPELKIDTSVAHPARVYDYWLGGKDNFTADAGTIGRMLAKCKE